MVSIPVSPDLVIRELLVSPRPTFVHTPGRVVAAPPSLRGVNLGLARCARCAARADMRPPDGAATGGRLQNGLRRRAFAAATGGCGSEGPCNPSLATELGGSMH